MKHILGQIITNSNDDGFNMLGSLTTNIIIYKLEDADN